MLPTVSIPASVELVRRLTRRDHESRDLVRAMLSDSASLLAGNCFRPGWRNQDGNLRDTLALQNIGARAIAEQIRINEGLF
jgi:hypothetical protein